MKEPKRIIRAKESEAHIVKQPKETPVEVPELEIHDSSCQTKKAGPPRCYLCNKIMEAWIRKFKPYSGVQGLLWICPDFCNINAFAKEANDSSHTTKKRENEE